LWIGAGSAAAAASAARITNVESQGFMHHVTERLSFAKGTVVSNRLRAVRFICGACAARHKSRGHPRVSGRWAAISRFASRWEHRLAALLDAERDQSSPGGLRSRFPGRFRWFGGTRVQPLHQPKSTCFAIAQWVPSLLTPCRTRGEVGCFFSLRTCVGHGSDIHKSKKPCDT
jgi:hypothetical protein